MPKAFSLTKKDHDTYMYLAGFVVEHGYAPSVREMCDHFDLTSTSTMQRRLDRLTRHGLIERVGARAFRFGGSDG